MPGILNEIPSSTTLEHDEKLSPDAREAISFALQVATLDTPGDITIRMQRIDMEVPKEGTDHIKMSVNLENDMSHDNETITSRSLNIRVQ
jgi:hypothetical protein